MWLSITCRPLSCGPATTFTVDAARLSRADPGSGRAGPRSGDRYRAALRRSIPSRVQAIDTEPRSGDTEPRSGGRLLSRVQAAPHRVRRAGVRTRAPGRAG